VTDSTVSRSARRDTWKRDGKAKGIYWRPRSKGGKTWGFYNPRIGRVEGGCRTRQEAIDKRARAQLDKSAGLPAPDTRARISDLAEDVREVKRARLRSSSFSAFEHALDNVLLPEVGHLKPSQCGPDRIARLIRDLETRGLAPATIRRYVSPLGAIFSLALRRGAISINPLELLTADERPTGGGVSDHYEWAPEEISALLTAAEALDQRPESRYGYAPLVKLLVLTGLRVSEALALRWQEVDLLGGLLLVRHSLNRDGTLGKPKTDAGEREVWLSQGLVETLVQLKPLDATEVDFVFASKSNRERPISYHNFRSRGFEPALEKAGLHGNGITIHSLRSAAISLYATRGLTLHETAKVMGQQNPDVTWKHYYRLFDKSNLAERVREAQSSITTESTNS